MTETTTEITVPAGTTAIAFKQETGTTGPVWFIVGGTGVYDLNAGWVPMITSDTPGFDGSPVPVWMKLSEARKIAKALGLPLETV